MSLTTNTRKTYSISCPECGKEWTYQTPPEELARKVDAALHWVERHDGPIPDEAPYGRYQCPECLDILGLDGTASCSECGYIPPEARL